MLSSVVLFLLIAQDHPCANCHSAESKSQPHTPMGTALEVDGNLLKKHNEMTADINGYKYVVQNNTYTVSNGTDTLSLPIRYGFGIGALGQTWVFEYKGRFYESMVSFYTRLNGLATTVGSERLRPKNLVEAMGRETSDDEIIRCFDCHSTYGTTGGKLTLTTMKPGLDCEKCHAGANAHREAMIQHKIAPLPQKLSERSAEDTSETCGTCHRTWSTVVRMRTWGENNVRFQPYRLANSKCFLGNDKRISCTACHNPHTDLVKSESSYDSKCQACHAPKACPVADKNCVSCHMPKVALPGTHSTFTDHQIRVVKAGERYPN